ncbi:two-component system response regulator [Thermoplasmatales archaeon ex4484_30]|nr:MAG: two-component system response regulator [Thermoplasmatales archaeon ex4484_30]
MRETMPVVLVVEDEEPIQELIKEYLSPLNLEIYQATSGEEGVEMYKALMNKKKKPDLVVMDLKLPGIDGVETTKRIMKIDPDANVYGFTAYFGTEWSKELEEAGAKGVIARPVGFEGFRDIVKRILQGEEI